MYVCHILPYISLVVVITLAWFSIISIIFCFIYFTPQIEIHFCYTTEPVFICYFNIGVEHFIDLIHELTILNCSFIYIYIYI